MTTSRVSIGERRRESTFYHTRLFPGEEEEEEDDEEIVHFQLSLNKKGEVPFVLHSGI